MGNFEKLSVLVIVVIIVMILVVALYTWQDDGEGSAALDSQGAAKIEQTEDPFPLPEPQGNGEPEWPVQDPLPPMPVIDDAPQPNPEPNPEDIIDAEPAPERAPEPTPDPAPADGENWKYAVKGGDTLGVIAQRELGTVRRLKEIMALNPGIDALKIREGDLIEMPPRGAVSGTRDAPSGDAPERTASGVKIAKGEYYVTKTGDTVQAMAKRAYGNHERWPELWARNLSAIPSIDKAIPVGTRVFIPR